MARPLIRPAQFPAARASGARLRGAWGALAAAAALLAGGPAWAHPHGAVECRAEAVMEQGRLAQLRGRLWLDAWHSQQALALVRDAATGQVDAARMQRFGFALKMQLGRLNWLYELDADGQRTDLRPAADPEIVFDGDRVRITVDYALAEAALRAERYSLHCADPTWYFVTAYGRTLAVAPPEAGAAADTDPQRTAVRLQALPDVPQNASALVVRGCAHLRTGAAASTDDPPRKGQAHLDFACAP
ncbi:MAG: DUF1007 family protein [Burkholderiaceae bacterium]